MSSKLPMTNILYISMEISQKILNKMASMEIQRWKKESREGQERQKISPTLQKMINLLSLNGVTLSSQQKNILVETSQLSCQELPENSDQCQNDQKKQNRLLQKLQQSSGSFWRKIQTSMSETYQKYIIGYDSIQQDSESKIISSNYDKESQKKEMRNMMEDLNEQIV